MPSGRLTKFPKADNYDSLIRERADSPYANIVVVRETNKNRPVFKKLVEAVHCITIARI